MKLDLKCVNAHDRCFEGGPCPLCEAVSFRDERGRFAKIVEPDEVLVKVIGRMVNE